MYLPERFDNRNIVPSKKERARKEKKEKRKYCMITVYDQTIQLFTTF